MDDDGLTVGEVAARLGITIRTLRYWDEIALVEPSDRSTRGYRLYGSKDISTLQRVLVYRGLGLSLDRIREILQGKEAEPIKALRHQQQLIRNEIVRLEELSIGVERLIHSHQDGVLLSPKEQTDIFGENWQPAWVTQARQRWGSSPQWSEYAEHASFRTPDEWRKIAEDTAALEAKIAKAFDHGVIPGSDAANALVEEHREVFSAYFHLTREMQVCLGRMYEADPAFSAHYESVRQGLVSWMRLAIDASARSRGIDPDSATWR